MPRLADVPLEERPRERLLRLGCRELADAELLAVLLGCGAPAGGGALESAGALLARFGDLRRLSSAGIAELCGVPGIGIAQACRIKAALGLAGRLADRPLQRGDRLGGPEDVFRRTGRRLQGLEREVFLALALDARHRVLAELHLAEGGACSVEVLPRDVFTGLVREAAAAVVFVHNHPSGDPSPSGADDELTRRLEAAGALLGIRVLDHIIVGHGAFHSFAGGRAQGA